jgi:3-methyladenine DNA glycosylase/8-oxoguanine DNA glycosylase
LTATVAPPAATRAEALIRIFTPAHPTDLRRTLSPVARGRRDRSMRVDPDGVWRATRTPDGPATQHLAQRGGDITVRAWGPGAQWLLDRAPVLVGGNDRHDDFDPAHDGLMRLHRIHGGVRTPCTQAVWEALLPTILEQKVTGKEARTSNGDLQRVLGEPAPRPPDGPALLLPLDPRLVADTPSHVFHACNVERKRSDAIRRAASYAPRLEEAAAMPMPEAYARIQALPGIGPWSAAEVAKVALGDSDAVSVGDYHLKNGVAWNLAGEPRGTDDRMLELLAPFRPYRGRVIRLLELGGAAAPRYGPRMSIRRWSEER